MCTEDKALAEALASNSRKQADCRQVCHFVIVCTTTERKGKDNHTITWEKKKKKKNAHKKTPPKPNKTPLSSKVIYPFIRKLKKANLQPQE